MACRTAVSQGGAYYCPSDHDRTEHPNLANRIWKVRKGNPLPELLGHGTGVLEALAMAVDGEVLASPSGKTGQGHYGFAIKKIIDATGHHDVKETLRRTWKRTESGSYQRDLAEFPE